MLNALMNRQWKEHFRVSRQTFDQICRVVAPNLNKQDTRLRRVVPLQKRVAVALWRLGTGNAFRATTITFGIGKATAVHICHEFSEEMNNLKDQYIKFPFTADETETCIRKFALKTEFPQVVGAIDGTHTEIKAPIDNGADYFNRKQHYSYVTQAVVDANVMFMDVSTGWPGSIHDARVLRLSALFQHAQNGEILSEPMRAINGCNVRPLILGDPAYPLLPWLMTAYPGRGNLNPAKERFNGRLSRARVIVERAFGKLKGRWRCLLKQLEKSTARVPSTILTCCILHNICILLDDDLDDDEPNAAEEEDIIPEGADAGPGRVVRQAITDAI